MKQLSLFFQQFSDNNPPSTGDVTPENDAMLSVASDQPGASSNQHLLISSTTSNLAINAAVQSPTAIQPTTNQPLISPSTTVPVQPTANQPLMSVPALVQPLVQPYNQPSLPPVPPRIKDRIIRGEFIDFASLLPKAIFSGTLEPETRRSLTVQLNPSGDNKSIQPASNLRKITSFSSWIEAWNTYLSIVIDHSPARVTKFVAYQRIITSASMQYPTASWLNYDVQFRTLAASNPTLQWDVRPIDLWLQFMSGTKPTQPTCWPYNHCGATNHYPDNCPFHPYHSPMITGGQRLLLEGNPTQEIKCHPTQIRESHLLVRTSTATPANAQTVSLPTAVNTAEPTMLEKAAPNAVGLPTPLKPQPWTPIRPFILEWELSNYPDKAFVSSLSTTCSMAAQLVIMAHNLLT